MNQDHKCPHCEIRLKYVPASGKFKCGICGSEITTKELGASESEEIDSLQFAREYLKSQKEFEIEKKGNFVFVHTDQLTHVPRWKLFLSFFGVPVEEHALSSNFPPVMGLFCLACILLFLKGEDTAISLALDPKQLSRHGGLTFITYSLLHTGLFHLLGNLFFIFPFIDNVEEKLGSFKAFLLIIFSALGSALLHLFFDSSGLPLLGASGVCFAIITYYAVKFPQNALLISPPLIGIFGMRYRLRIQARSFAIFYFVKELFGVFAQINGMSDVSHLGHIGGALVALIFCKFVDDEL